MTVAGYANQGYNGVGSPGKKPNSDQANNGFGNLHLYIRLISIYYTIKIHNLYLNLFLNVKMNV